MPQFRVPNRNDRFGFNLSLDARITEFKLSNTADLIGNLILVGVDPEDAKRFRNSNLVTVILDWVGFDEECQIYGLTAMISSGDGLCATMEIQVPASERLQLDMKAALMEEWVDVTVTRLKEFGFGNPWI